MSDGAPALAWTQKSTPFNADPTWYAFAGSFSVGVSQHANRYYTEVAFAPCSVHDTLVAAQLAAESAVAAQLVGALASLPVDVPPPGDVTLHVQHDCADAEYDVENFAEDYPDDAIILARALLVAARAAKGGGE